MPPVALLPRIVLLEEMPSLLLILIEFALIDGLLSLTFAGECKLWYFVMRDASPLFCNMRVNSTLGGECKKQKALFQTHHAENKCALNKIYKVQRESGFMKEG